MPKDGGLGQGPPEAPAALALAAARGFSILALLSLSVA